MNSFRDQLRQKELGALVIAVCFFLFVFPLFVLPSSSQTTVFLTFFSVWLIAILLLFLVSRGFKEESATDRSAEEEDV
jgi:hypothetical protein